MIAAHTYTLTALTDIWTGDASGKPGRLIHTGLLGSIRWWFEVLVRGLGGSACDPSNTQARCPDRQGRRCVVCELFGCTGWARKFRLDVLGSGGTTQKDQIKAGKTFELRFTPLRPIAQEEWTLLDVTIRLIADYGAIGGKTVYKPTEETSRLPEQHHQDLGLVKLVSSTPGRRFHEEELRRYVSLPEWRELTQKDFAWASLQHFWCVLGRHLSREGLGRSSFNRVLGRHESKECRDCGKVHDPPLRCPETGKHPRRHSDQSPTADCEKWLAGGRAESKKVFSFKNPARTFGFVNPGTITFGEMLARLKGVWDLNDGEFIFIRGGDILDRLLGSGAGGTL
ncbi:MAG: type III-B CRISPR module RAMP protein Cmr1 [Vicinamibacterales bacterium]